MRDVRRELSDVKEVADGRTSTAEIEARRIAAKSILGETCER